VIKLVEDKMRLITKGQVVMYHHRVLSELLKFIDLQPL